MGNVRFAMLTLGAIVLATTSITMISKTGSHPPESRIAVTVEPKEPVVDVVRERDYLRQRVRDLSERPDHQNYQFNPYTFDFDRRDLRRGIDPPTKDFPD